MFDISFAELMVIAVVMLLVIGPEKLPKVARTFGAYAGRMQRFMAQVKDEVNRETRFEELQKLQQEVKSSVMQTESSIMGHVSQLQADISSSQPVADEMTATVSPIPVEAEVTATPAVKAKRSVKAKAKSTAPVALAKADLADGVLAETTSLAAEKTSAAKKSSAAKKPRTAKPKSS